MMTSSILELISVCLDPVSILTTVWLAACRSFKVPWNARIGHSDIICGIVWDTYQQSRTGEFSSFHLCSRYWHLPCPVCRRFNVTHTFFGRSKPGCLIVGLLTIFCVSGLSDSQSCCHFVFGWKFCRISFLEVNLGGLRDLSLGLSFNDLRSVCIGRFGLLVNLIHSRITNKGLFSSNFWRENIAYNC